MQTVLLAGGLGTRLRDVAPGMPKVLVPVGGKPFLGHMLEMLARHGLTEFLLLLGYRSESIVSYVETDPVPGAKIAWSIESEPLGTGGGLKLAEPHLEDEFLLLNGDSYLDMDYEGLVGRFRAESAEAMLVVYDNAEQTDVVNNVELGPDGRVAVYRKEAPEARLTHVDAGVLALRKTVLDRIPADTACSMENEIYPKLIQAGQLAVYITGQRFYDIGTAERLAGFKQAVGESGRQRRYG